MSFDKTEICILDERSNVTSGCIFESWRAAIFAVGSFFRNGSLSKKLSAEIHKVDSRRFLKNGNSWDSNEQV